MKDTVQRGPGRPKGAPAEDPDSAIDVIIMRRQDAEADQREEASRKARRAFSEHERKAANERAWAAHWRLMARNLQQRAGECIEKAEQLERGRYW